MWLYKQDFEINKSMMLIILLIIFQVTYCFSNEVSYDYLMVNYTKSDYRSCFVLPIKDGYVNKPFDATVIYSLDAGSTSKVSRGIGIKFEGKINTKNSGYQLKYTLTDVSIDSWSASDDVLFHGEKPYFYNYPNFEVVNLTRLVDFNDVNTAKLTTTMRDEKFDLVFSLLKLNDAVIP